MRSRWKECAALRNGAQERSEEHTSELQSRQYIVCRLLREKKKTKPSDGHSDRFVCFFWNHTAAPEIHTLSLHDALPISIAGLFGRWKASVHRRWLRIEHKHG